MGAIRTYPVLAAEAAEEERKANQEERERRVARSHGTPHRFRSGKERTIENGG